MRSFRLMNPDWEIRLFTDSDIAGFINAEFPGLVDTIRRFPGGVYLADIWRCLALYRYGGVYSDIDVECIRPLDELLEAIEVNQLALEDTEIFVSRDHPVHERIHFGGRAMFMNFFMIAKPGARFLRAYIERMEELVRNGSNLRIGPIPLTGPGAFSDLVESAGGPEQLGISVLPWEWISPLPDMAIPSPFPERDSYHRMIQEGDWSWSANPFVAHYWWHNYSGASSNLSIYGEALFQSDGLVVSRRLETLVPAEDEQAYISGRALAEFAEMEDRLLVAMGGERGSRTFSSLASSALHNLDYRDLDDFPTDGKAIGLLCLDAHDEQTLGRFDAVVSRGLIAPGGLVLLPQADSCRKALRNELLARALARGFEIIEDQGGLLLRAPRNASPMIIPRVIHQTWRTKEIPATFRPEWINSWLIQHSDSEWEYRLWTDSDLLQFVEEEFPEFIDCYCDYDHPIKRVDAARYLLLKRFGGIYVDLDFACLKPLDGLLADKRLLFGTEFDDLEERPNCVSNALMASVPGHPFWGGIEADLRSNADRESLWATGNYFLGQRLRRASNFLDPSDLPAIAQREILYPFRWDDSAREQARDTPLADLRALYPNSHAVIFWTASCAS